MRTFSAELAACVREPSGVTRIFQMVATVHDCATSSLDDVWDAMAVSDAVPPHIASVAKALACASTRPRKKLLVCDVDGVLFDITPELLARDLGEQQADTFFFNSEESVPDALSPHIRAFLVEAQAEGYTLAIVSGRDESILECVRARVEHEDGKTPALRPICYLFKDVGSSMSTIEHKEAAVRQLLAGCAQAGVDVQRVLCIDDVEPQMQAMRHGCGSTPHFGFIASGGDSGGGGSGGGIQLQPHLADVKHCVIPQPRTSLHYA